MKKKIQKYLNYIIKESRKIAKKNKRNKNVIKMHDLIILLIQIIELYDKNNI